MPPVLRFVEKREPGERVEGVPEDSWGTSIDSFPFEIEEPAEAPQRFADVDVDILPLTGPVSPQRRDRNGLGGKANRGHSPKPMRARNNRITAVEGEFAAAVRGR